LLVLTRKKGQAVWIGDTRVVVRSVGQRAVQLVIDAPNDVPVDREEVRKEKDHQREIEEQVKWL